MNLQRIQHLIALAGNNPNEHEARTAAHLACRAILAGGVVLLEPTDVRLLPRAAPPPPPQPQPQPPPPPRPAPAAAPPTDEARSIPLAHPARCRVCGDNLAIGTRAWWRRGTGCWCHHHGRGAA